MTFREAVNTYVDVLFYDKQVSDKDFQEARVIIRDYISDEDPTVAAALKIVNGEE